MKQFESKGCSLINPFFIATVEDNKDPDFNYRVKVRHPKLHPSAISTKELPWAARVDTAFFGMSDDGDINHSIPAVGSQVLCLAIGNNLNSLLYVGCLYKKNNNTPSGEQYTESWGVYGKNGHFIGIDKIEETFKLIYEGKINIDKIKEMTINVDGDVTLECKNLKIKKGKVEITEAQMNAFTCIPNCLFTGAKHTTNQSS